MKKTIIISAMTIGLILLLVGSFIYIKLNPSLVIGTVATGNDNQIVLVEVGNNGFEDIKITDVLVNNNEHPQKFMVQESNPLKGFIITDKFDKNSNEEYGISNIEDVIIRPDTSPTTQMEKVNNGTANEKDKSYGLSVVYNKGIEIVKIKYSYLGFPFEETVSIIK